MLTYHDIATGITTKGIARRWYNIMMGYWHINETAIMGTKIVTIIDLGLHSLLMASPLCSYRLHVCMQKQIYNIKFSS